MDLPELPGNFQHALVEEISIGPRREITLRVLPLIWSGNQGHYGSAVAVRLGGIVNFAEASAFVTKKCAPESELACLRYEGQPHPGVVLIRLEMERIEAGATVRCSSVTLNEE